MPKRSYPRGFHTVGALIMLTLGVAGWFFLRDMHDRKLRKAILEDRWVPSWNVQEFEAVAVVAESNYLAAIAALDAHDHQAVYRFTKTRGVMEFQPWVEHHPAREYKSNVTVRAFYDYLQARYLAALLREFEWTANEVRAGRRPLNDLQDLALWHPEVLGLWEQFEALAGSINNRQPAPAS